VAVEERSAADRTSLPAELRRIPIALTSGWGGSSGKSRQGAPMVMAMAMPVGAPPVRKRAPHFAPVASAAPSFVARAAQSIYSAFTGGSDGQDEPMPDLTVDAPPAASAFEAPDRLFDLLMTQRADGSFPVSPVLRDWLGSERAERMSKACAQHGEALVVTSVVIELIQLDEARRASEWTPALAKARGFCAKQVAPFDPAAILA
jgi:hypothetical protein